MEVNGTLLQEGKFYLFNLAKQAGTGVELHSVYFVTDADQKVYEVVFTTPNTQTNNGWYLVEKDVKLEEPIQEAEIVEPTSVEEDNQGGGTLSIAVEDELNLGELLGG